MNARVLAVTGLLALLGGFIGALGGALIALGLLGIVSGTAPNLAVLRAVFATAGVVGFGVGVIAGPVLSWTLLRKAPIWRAIGEPAIGAAVGASIALALQFGTWEMIGVSLLGATLAALRLRRSVSRAPAPTA